MNIDLFTPLPPDVARERLHNALRAGRRAVWVGGSRRSVVGHVTGDTFELWAYLAHPYAHVFALGGTFVPVEGGTMLDASYGIHLDVWSAVNILPLLILAVFLPFVAAHTPFFPYALAGGACLAGWLTVLGPRLMWRVWRDEVLAFLKDGVGAEPMEGRSTQPSIGRRPN